MNSPSSTEACTSESRPWVSTTNVSGAPWAQWQRLKPNPFPPPRCGLRSRVLLLSLCRQVLHRILFQVWEVHSISAMIRTHAQPPSQGLGPMSPSRIPAIVAKGI